MFENFMTTVITELSPTHDVTCVYLDLTMLGAQQFFRRKSVTSRDRGIVAQCTKLLGTQKHNDGSLTIPITYKSARQQRRAQVFGESYRIRKRDSANGCLKGAVISVGIGRSKIRK